MHMIGNPEVVRSPKMEVLTSCISQSLLNTLVEIYLGLHMGKNRIVTRPL